LGPYDIALAKEELLHMANEEGEIRKDKVERFERRKIYHEKQKEMSDTLAEKVVQLQRKNIDRELTNGNVVNGNRKIIVQAWMK
jgi:hypothetical protein